MPGLRVVLREFQTKAAGCDKATSVIVPKSIIVTALTVVIAYDGGQKIGDNGNDSSAG